MKELSIEEKAKRYDEAIEIAKSKIKNDKDHVLYEDDVIEIFPELAELEDERIRKELLLDIPKVFPHDKAFRYIVYLEKQGEKKSLDDIAKEVTKDKDAAMSFLKSCGIINANGELADEYKIEQDEQKSEEVYNLHNYLYGKQKPADKVEPKFKVRDWIITSKNHIWYVDETPETTSYLYRLINQYGKVEVAEFEVVEKEAKLWTIQDAKDGDVLAYKNDIVIFKENNYEPKDKSGCMFVHCSCDNFYEIGGINPTYYKPATKEQRDFLFQKMKESGYKWDVDEKKLKKIEQEPAEWSDEDERALNDAIVALSMYANGDIPPILPSILLEDVEKLKFLKERYTWKPSDEQMTQLKKYCPDNRPLTSLYKQLKKLRE